MKKKKQSNSVVKPFKHPRVDYKTAEWLSEMFQICTKLRNENTELSLQLLAMHGQQQDGGWRLIKTAPKDGTQILIYCGDEWGGICVGHYGELISWDYETGDEEIEVCWQSGLDKIRATHWMPLPKEPTL